VSAECPLLRKCGMEDVQLYRTTFDGELFSACEDVDLPGPIRALDADIESTPKDKTAAERMRRYRNERNGTVTR
jgi:hypothetical protein